MKLILNFILKTLEEWVLAFLLIVFGLVDVSDWRFYCILLIVGVCSGISTKVWVAEKVAGNK